MRHRVAGSKLGRTTSHRIAMTRNMTNSLILHERIITTVTGRGSAAPERWMINPNSRER